ncbi:potassium-transporting ATPase subunit KdpC [Clostridium estertheticum]|uniref:potassium-transporting ATPase subunit KdpC n=1 Tax=Clostridium estertheticum TaxID=238834 RepID=UPI001C6DDF14|nr:potassium-transporting ATPase subunit KdpC [Clostridium estertheticum]MBW9151104.1 potassium-transporting ATPase subunit KdpC [Clostridium estertheticum]WLC84897.1 potassium-transporting ATPase subunit KdpC [Clostridium estertheticum]
MKDMLKKSVLLSVVLFALCGLIYPLTMTGISQVLFNKKANGSMVSFYGKDVGSGLIGQSFTDKRFFRGRVSSSNYNTYTKADLKPDSKGNIAYTGVTSGSSNLGPSNPVLMDRVRKDMGDFLKSHPGLKAGDVPTDLLTSSASGLDPNISPQAAKIQVSAVAKATNISSTDLNNIILNNTEGRTLGIFGEPRVNVLKANLDIANILKSKGTL